MFKNHFMGYRSCFLLLPTTKHIKDVFFNVQESLRGL